MGFFKCLAYVAGGVGAIVLAPVTGGSSLALAIGAMGTTTAAGAAIGAGLGAAAAAADHASSSKDKAYKQGVTEGSKAGERAAQQKYEAKIAALAERLQSYQDFDKKLVAMYAIGLAVANADGFICEEERSELDQFVAGCMSGHLPEKVTERIEKLTAKPPTLPQALQYAKRASLPKKDIDDIIDIIAHADGSVNTHEQQFIARWKASATDYQSSLA
ncbi:TerB family tellurite resistance protein [Massilia sp. CMS3.1]|uniref:TerB family tellurite resistance protein n=1 Tax=Massilia sp. CMS3.1 TaxID=3373083 RepID=UPI003EE4F185